MNNNSDSGIRFPFPLFNFDWDKTAYKSGNEKIDTTSLEARGRIEGKTYRYDMSYGSFKQESNREANNRDTRSFKIETENEIRLYTVRNFLEFVTQDSISHTRFETYISRFFEKEKDTSYYVDLRGAYYDIEGSDSYSVALTGKMNKRVSPVLTTVTSATVRASNGILAESVVALDSWKSVRRYDYSLTLGEDVVYTGLRGLTLTAGAHLTLAEGTPFDMVVSATSTKWRNFSPYGSYSFRTEFSGENGNLSGHNLTLGFTSRPLANLTFDSRYQLTMDEGFLGFLQSKTTTHRIEASLGWTYGIHRLGLWGDITDATRKEGGFVARPDQKSRIFGLSANYSASFFRQTTFDLGIRYDNDTELKRKDMTAYSRFNWRYGLFTLTAEFEARKHDELTQHRDEKRIYLRVSRTFSRMLR